MEIKNIWIGIDPGSTGAICAIMEVYSGKIEVETYRFGLMTDKDICESLDYVSINPHSTIKGVLEQVHSIHGVGAQSSFKFGQNFGFIKGVLQANGIPYEEVLPTKWMKYYGMKKDKEESKTEWKKRLRQRAEQLYPSVKITADTADAVLIANYCKNS